FRFTTRACDTIRPTDSYHATECGIRIGKVFDSFDECLREWSFVFHAENLARITNMSQVYYYPTLDFSCSLCLDLASKVVCSAWTGSEPPRGSGWVRRRLQSK